MVPPIQQPSGFMNSGLMVECDCIQQHPSGPSADQQVVVGLIFLILVSKTSNFPLVNWHILA
jgi:hypothetical protein